MNHIILKAALRGCIDRNIFEPYGMRKMQTGNCLHYASPNFWTSGYENFPDGKSTFIEFIINFVQIHNSGPSFKRLSFTKSQSANTIIDTSSYGELLTVYNHLNQGFFQELICSRWSISYLAYCIALFGIIYTNKC